MSTEWTELTNIAAVATAQEEDMEIEIDITGIGGWRTWNGKVWESYMRYRGRPKPPQTIAVKLLAWYDGECLSWKREDFPAIAGFHRVPKEDKTIEVIE